MSTDKSTNLAIDRIGRITGWRIIRCIKKYDFSGGRRVKDIANDPDVNVNLSTVTRHCKLLEKEGLIRKKNKQSEYHLTPRAYDNQVLLDIIFEGKSKVWQTKIPMAEINSKGKKIIQNKFLEYDYKLKSKHEDYSDQFELSIFANKIGAMITYLFVEAVSPFELIGLSNEEKKRISGRYKDQLTINWIRELIDPLAIFSEFCKLNIVKRGLAVWGKMSYTEQSRNSEIKRFKESREISKEEKEKQIKIINRKFKKIKELDSKQRKWDPGNPNWSRYEIDKENFKHLLETYANVFPLIFERMSNNTNRLHEEHMHEFTKNHAI
jgi:DNA-binding transcriptional regulator YhcF (GntR family)